MLSAAVPFGLLATESVAVTVQLAPAPEACATARPVVAPMVAALAGVQGIVQVTGFAEETPSCRHSCLPSLRTESSGRLQSLRSRAPRSASPRLVEGYPRSNRRCST